MNILMIAPNAPPKNSPESIQVGRYLQELDKKHNITLVTTPDEKGWIQVDKSLAVSLSRTKVLFLSLPMHDISARLLATRYLSFVTNPDKDFWIQFKVPWILSRLDHIPDVIYSRSFPISSALLALKIKRRLGVPWIMHLSDPWSDSPYLVNTPYYSELLRHEKNCFEAADLISVTTESLLQFYQVKYPQFADKFITSSNVMPTPGQHNFTAKTENNKLLIVYTGALYGQRRPTIIWAALKLLEQIDQRAFNSIMIQFIGNVTEDIKREFITTKLPQISVSGRRTYAEISSIQNTADIMLSIEPDGSNPILKTFLPSKILDYIAANKPFIAVTPEGSESWKLCNRGYGWAIKPSESDKLANLFSELVRVWSDNGGLLRFPVLPPPAEYSASVCVKHLSHVMCNLVKSHRAASA